MQNHIAIIMIVLGTLIFVVLTAGVMLLLWEQ